MVDAAEQAVIDQVGATDAAGATVVATVTETEALTISVADSIDPLALVDATATAVCVGVHTGVTCHSSLDNLFSTTTGSGGPAPSAQNAPTAAPTAMAIADCFQSYGGTVSGGWRACPAHKPECAGYVQGASWGTCTAPAATSAPARRKLLAVVISVSRSYVHYTAAPLQLPSAASQTTHLPASYGVTAASSTRTAVDVDVAVTHTGTVADSPVDDLLSGVVNTQAMAEKVALTVPGVTITPAVVITPPLPPPSAPPPSPSPPTSPPPRPSQPPLPPAVPLPVITVEVVASGDAATVCTESNLAHAKAITVAALKGIGLSDVTVDCALASVKLIITVTIPLSVSLSATQTTIEALFHHAGTATAFLKSGGLDLQVVSNPLINGAQRSLLPACGCDNFRNGLTTDDVGTEGCSRDEVHGLQGVKTLCMPPARPRIPFLDDGCPSDMYRCIVTHVAPTFPSCSCTSFARGAFAGDPNGTCQKIKDGVCMPRNYVGDKKIGGSEYYGCPEDTFRCA